MITFFVILKPGKGLKKIESYIPGYKMARDDLSKEICFPSFQDAKTFLQEKEGSCISIPEGDEREKAIKDWPALYEKDNCFLLQSLGKKEFFFIVECFDYYNDFVK